MPTQRPQPAPPEQKGNTSSPGSELSIVWPTTPVRPLVISTETVEVDESGNVCLPISVTRLTAGPFCTDIYPSEVDAIVRQLHSVTLRTHTENQRRTPFVTYPQVR